VTGDIREIHESDLSALESLSLPKGIYGRGMGYEFQNIADGPVMSSERTLFYSIKKRRPILLKNWFAELSRDSPHYYKGFEVHNDRPHFISTSFKRDHVLVTDGKLQMAIHAK
jgi:hypothetical protein